ncbi:MAG: Leukotoxin [Planctomycetota bacterium]|jgi:hypothetical protein
MSILLPTVPFLKHPSCLLLPRAVAFALALSPSMCIRASHAAEDNGTICLNEVRIDQPGADNDEYVELKGPPGASLDGLWFVVVGDGTAAQGSGVIEVFVNLAGKTIPSDGYLLIGESSMTAATPDFVTNLNFENTDNVTHMLLRGLTAANGADLDADDDCTLDPGSFLEIVDAVTIGTGALPPIAGAECGYATTVGPEKDAQAMHILRCRSGGWVRGSDAVVGGDDTPGAVNGCDATSSACAGDLNGNGSVENADLGILLVKWEFPDPLADLDGSGLVDGPDLGIMLSRWGACPD